MIISRKRYEKAINEAVNKALEEQDKNRWIHQRIDRVEQRIDRTNKRLSDELQSIKSRLNNLGVLSGVEVTEIKCDMMPETNMGEVKDLHCSLH